MACNSVLLLFRTTFRSDRYILSPLRGKEPPQYRDICPNFEIWRLLYPLRRSEPDLVCGSVPTLLFLAKFRPHRHIYCRPYEAKTIHRIIPRYVIKFSTLGASAPTHTPFAGHGQIWHATVHPCTIYTLRCQILSVSFCVSPVERRETRNPEFCHILNFNILWWRHIAAQR